MDAVFTALHVIVCIFLVAVVLLQRGRGAQVGAVFGGGGGGTMFGSRGAGNFLTKLTTGAAIVFMLTSLSLSYLGVDGSEENAGAMIAPSTLADGAAAGVDAGRSLDGNDAYTFFEAAGGLVETGPTFTNVNDFRAILVHPLRD